VIYIKNRQNIKILIRLKKYYKDICLRALKNTLAGTRDFDIDMTNLSDYNLETEE
jgi:hypothetical protein